MVLLVVGTSSDISNVSSAQPSPATEAEGQDHHWLPLSLHFSKFSHVINQFYVCVPTGEEIAVMG